MKDFYEINFNNFGYDPRSLGWSDKHSQVKRFQKILEAGISRGDSVLDVGSGFGDFYNFAKKALGDIDYTGIEKCKVFLDVSKKIVDSDAKLIQGDIWETKISNNFDWVIASGLFPFDYEGYSQDLFYTTKKMFLMCNKGVCLNLLSTNTPEDERFYPMKYNKPSDVCNMLLDISPKFSLIHGYMNNDMTIHLYR